MSFPAVKESGHPGGTGCSSIVTEGQIIEVTECPEGNLWYKIKIAGEEIEIDLKPTRILIKHNSTTVEVKQNSVDIVGNTNLTGNLSVTGNISVTGNVSVGGDVDVVNDIFCENITVRGEVMCEELYVNSPRGYLNVGGSLHGLLPP